MKRPTVLPLLALITLLFVSCSTDNMDDSINETTSYSNNIVVPEDKSIEVQILDLINDFRISEGLNPLNKMDIIKYQAYNHTEYMVTTNDVSHYNFNQRRAFLINNAGADYVSENVAYGYTTPESVVNAWINSDAHRENLKGNFTDFDISAEQDDEGHWYYTNIFIRK